MEERLNRPVRLEWRTGLRVFGGRLLEGPGPGEVVHAAAYPRQGRLVLDRDLLTNPAELERIAWHEAHHFLWPRLGNARRWAWAAVLQRELALRARGELGWSSEWRKQRLGVEDPLARTRRWREYVCESYCDTGAWLASGLPEHDEFTLAGRHRQRRRAWFEALPARLRL